MDLEHISGKNIGNSFLSTLQSTNWKVMRYYNLVFNLKIFVHNLGCILILILFVIYVLFIVYFCHKEIEPLKVKASKILFKESNEQIEKEKYISSNYKIKTEPKSKDKIKYHKNHNLPKKAKSRHANSELTNYDKTVAKTEEKKLVTYKRNKVKNFTKKTTLRENSSRKFVFNIERYIDKENKTKNEEENNKRKHLDDFELNNLDYYDACELDK